MYNYNVHYRSKVSKQKDVFSVLEKKKICWPRLHFFDQEYGKNGNVVNY